MADWRSLLREALPTIDEAIGAENLERKDPEWTLGGGAAISALLDHRNTQDVDIFIHRKRLKEFSPSFNQAARALSDRFQWPGHYLKFERPDGEIDFLSAPLQTDPGFTLMEIDGRTVAMETPEEVIVKKIRYRAANFAARDVFDLAAVAEALPHLPKVLAEEVPDVLDKIGEWIRIHADRGVDALKRSIDPTETGHELLTRAFDVARKTIAAAETITNEGRAPEAPSARPNLKAMSKGPKSSDTEPPHDFYKKVRER